MGLSSCSPRHLYSMKQFSTFANLWWCWPSLQLKALKVFRIFNSWYHQRIEQKFSFICRHVSKDDLLQATRLGTTNSSRREKTAAHCYRNVVNNEAKHTIRKGLMAMGSRHPFTTNRNEDGVILKIGRLTLLHRKQYVFFFLALKLHWKRSETLNKPWSDSFPFNHIIDSRLHRTSCHALWAEFEASSILHQLLDSTWLIPWGRVLLFSVVERYLSPGGREMDFVAVRQYISIVSVR